MIVRTATAALLVLGMATAASAQGAMMKPADAKGAMAPLPGKAPPMSDKDKAMMKSCQAMSHDAMMKDQKCAAMMKPQSNLLAPGTGNMMMKPSGK